MKLCTINDFMSKCTDNVVVDLWSTSLSAIEPLYSLSVKDLKKDYSDLLGLKCIDFRVTCTGISIWCVGLLEARCERG